MLVSTLFNWFADWVKKTFQSFIKGLLLDINIKKNTRKYSGKRYEKSIKLEHEIAEHRKSIKSIEKELEAHRSSNLHIKKSELLDPPENLILGGKSRGIR